MATFNTYKTLRLTRICVSVAVCVAIFFAVAFGYDLWLTRWQIVPACLAGVFAWIVGWIVVTAVCGRVYCSTVCPMGTTMDVFGRLGHLKKGYFFSPSRFRVRRSITIISVAAFLVGIPAMLNLIDPAAAFSRVASWAVTPAFRPVAFSAGAALTAYATLAIVAAVAFARGRLLCNTLCPVGAVLAEISRYSVYHIDINTDKCIGCGLCTEKCKSECIDPNSHTVDPARCVVCFDCTAACPNAAISYRRGRHRLAMPMMETAGSSRLMDRRDFLAAVMGGIPAMALASETMNPDLEPLNPVHPPGLHSSTDLRLRCTGCGQCSAACPTGIIRPVESLGSLRTPLRPVLEFDSGCCLYDCTACTQVCPTGALSRLSVSEKHRFVIGKARIVPAFCIEFNTGEGCGECARRCPKRAITINPVEEPVASPGHAADIPEKTALGKIRRLPRVDVDECIGCGTCRYVCPARPRAFVIEGEQ